MTGNHRARAPRNAQGRRRRRWYAGAAVFALASVAMLVLGPGLPIGGSGRAVGAPGGTPRCSTPAIELRVISSHATVTALRSIADGYESTEPAINGRCLTITIGYAPGILSTQLSGVVDDGPGQPDVWIPDSTLWLQALANTSDAMRVHASIDHPSIATSPTVLAMPRPMAEALGWPDQQLGLARLRELTGGRRGWGAVGHAGWGAFRVDGVDPRLSTGKAHTMLALAYDVLGSTRPSADRVAGHQVVRAFLELDRAPGPDESDPADLLAGLRRVDGVGTALTHLSVAALDEMSVLAYNRGQLPGARVAGASAAPPSVPLAAFYPPEGTFVSDYPFVVLTDAPDRRRAAQSFVEHVQSPAAQAVLQRFGFRDHRGVAAPDATADHGVLPRLPTRVLPQPGPAVAGALLRGIGKLRTRSNVLMVLDVSGSMAAKVNGSPSRLALAKRAAINSLALSDGDDQGGLWAFSTLHRELVRPGPMSHVVGGVMRRDAIRSHIEALRAGGDTALYDTAWAAHQRVAKDSFQSDIRNSVILLTDGRNDVPRGLTLEVLLRRLRRANRSRPVRIIVIAYGAAADVPALRRIAAATSGAVFTAPDPADIDRVYAAAIAAA